MAEPPILPLTVTLPELPKTPEECPAWAARLTATLVLQLRRVSQVATSEGIFAGTGTPEGAITANIGSLYRRTDGGAATTLYVKESGVGNTGWVGK